ncbi:sensor domain-containing diguanylate cyclase [Paractinoplanes deccanensis]|uniref:sensor domain-containing diguanylate cyclase n=1 Tax=Paractinoplanes deccanensis TaxID=113561 RepID=UPI0019429078|nr:sensor domain-containing diguanylate cyclase [Actinoplanes deccanensis]
MTRSLDAGSTKWVLGSLAAFFTLLAGIDLAIFDGTQRAILAGVAAISAVVLAAGAVLVRRRRPGRQPAVLSVFGFIPVLNGLAPLFVTGELHQTSMLMLIMVGLGVAVSSTAFAIAAAATATAGWIAAVLLRDDLHTGELTYYAVQFGLALTMGTLLRVSLIRRQRLLRAMRDELAEAAERFQGVFEGSPAGIGLAGTDGRFVTVNPALCRILGREQDEVIGQDVFRYAHPDDRFDLDEIARRIAEASDGVARMEVRFCRPGDDTRWVWLTLCRTPTSGDGNRTLVQMQDVTARYQAERATRDSERLLAAVAGVARRIRTGEDARTNIINAVRDLASSDGVMLMEPVTATEELVVTAASQQHLVGTRIPLALTSMTAEVYRTGQPVFRADPAADPVVSPALLELTRARSLLWQPVIADGTVIAVLCVSWARRLDDVGGRRARAVALLADETALALEHEQLLRHLERMAYTDTLTGLANRRAWQAQLPRLLAQARRTGGSLTVAIADLDHFKRYNDTYGHPAGDELLRQTASAFTQALRDSDLIARWGGEEFAMALPDCPAPDAAQVLDRVRAATPGAETCSIGYATWDGTETVEQLLSRADDALYQAKEGGRNAVREAAVTLSA